MSSRTPIELAYRSCYFTVHRVSIYPSYKEGSKHSLLDDDPRALRDEDEVCKAVHDHRALALLDHAREHRERGRERLVARAADEHVDVGALAPRHVHGRVDRALHLLAVEVERGLGLRERATRSRILSVFAIRSGGRLDEREAEDVPQDWPLDGQHIVSVLAVSRYRDSRKGTYGVEDTIDVERRVDGKRGVHNVVPHIASGVSFDAFPRERQETLRGICDVLLHVACISALLGDGIEVGHEGRAEGVE